MPTMTQSVPLRGSLNEMANLQNRFNSIFSEFARSQNSENQAEGAAASRSFVPAVDIYEDVEALVLQLEVPGVKQHDLDIRIANQPLTVKDERKFESGVKQENFDRIERRFGCLHAPSPFPRRSIRMRSRPRTMSAC